MNRLSSSFLQGFLKVHEDSGNQNSGEKGLKKPEQSEKAMGAGGSRVLMATLRCGKDPGVGSAGCQIRPWSGQERGQRRHGAGDIGGEETKPAVADEWPRAPSPLLYFWEMPQVTPQPALERGTGVHQLASPLPMPPTTEGPHWVVTLQGTHNVPTSGLNPWQGCR